MLLYLFVSVFKQTNEQTNEISQMRRWMISSLQLESIRMIVEDGTISECYSDLRQEPKGMLKLQRCHENSIFISYVCSEVSISTYRTKSTERYFIL